MMKKNKSLLAKIPLHWKIIIAMLLGILFSLGLLQTNWANEIVPYVGAEKKQGALFVAYWIKPFGDLFINVLKLIAIPLILASLIKGISDLKEISKLSKLGFKTLGIYLLTTIFAVSVGLTMVNLLKPGNSISESTRTELLDAYGISTQTNVVDKAAEEKMLREKIGPLKPLVDVVPDNLFKAASENRNMLQVIFFAILFGIGLILVPGNAADTVKSFFSGLNEVILKMIDIIMLFAPIAVFALMANLVAEAPSMDLFMALGHYALTVVAGLFILLIVYLLIIWFYVGISPMKYLQAISPAQLLAFSTSSSAATLPVTMERVEEKLGVEPEISSFVLPLGATINMDGTSLYQGVAAVFIAQAFGLELSLGAQLGILAAAVLASIGSAAVPSAGMVMLVIVLGQAGIPEAGLALIFAMDRPLDMLRTVVNVTGDATVATVIAKNMNQIHEPHERTWDEKFES
jgi:proton glutamate symport protein